MLVNTSHSKEDVLASLIAMLPKLVAAGYCNFDPVTNEITTTHMLEVSNAAATKQKAWDSLSIQLTNLHHGQIEMAFGSNEIVSNGAEPFYLTPETKVQVRDGKLVSTATGILPTLEKLLLEKYFWKAIRLRPLHGCMQNVK